MNKVVVFKRNTPATLGAGKADSFATYCTTRGSLKKLNGNRSLSFGELLQGNSWEMWTRFNTDIETYLRMDNRIEIGSRVFTIQSFEKIGEKRFYYKFILNEQNA